MRLWIVMSLARKPTQAPMCLTPCCFQLRFNTPPLYHASSPLGRTNGRMKGVALLPALAYDRQNNTLLANLFVRMLQQMGIEKDSFGASDGIVSEV